MARRFQTQLEKADLDDIEGVPFAFRVPISFFEKADAPEGQRRRVGGPISVSTWDKQDELVLQRGLDLEEFARDGWYNDNHSRDLDGVLGFPDPETIAIYEKGEALPDGEVAPEELTWSEGWLLENDERADKVWRKAQALKKAGRRLGFSIEGKVVERTGPGNRVIAKAKVRNVAITHCPVNPDTRLEVLAKSLGAFERGDDSLLRALSMGSGEVPTGPKTGEGAGAIITPESVEGVRRRRKKRVTKSLAWWIEHLPRVRDPELLRAVAAWSERRGRAI